MKNWENSLEVEFDQLSNSIGKKWNNNRSDSILTLPLLDYINEILKFNCKNVNERIKNQIIYSKEWCEKYKIPINKYSHLHKNGI